MWSVVITLHISIFFYDSTTTETVETKLRINVNWMVLQYRTSYNIHIWSYVKCYLFWNYKAVLEISICTWIFIGWSCTEFMLMFSSLKLQSWLQVLVYQTAYEYSFDVHVQNECFCQASSNIKISCSYILFTSR